VAPRKAPAPKKPQRLSPRLTQLILVVLGVLACLALVGFYLVGGYYFNGLIAQTFATRNCAEVLQQQVFISLYPEGLFGSRFTGYGQYEQCRLKQSMDQAVTAKNWEGALALTEQYLAAYPNGAFAMELGPLAPEFLSTRATELLAAQNYLEAIGKLKSLLKTYPDSQPAQAAPEAIFQAYLAWGQKLIAAQNYKTAELPLKEALAYFEADPARAEQIKQTLVNLYVAWGDEQIQLGNLENGTAAYQKAAEVAPGAVDAALLVAKAHLQNALQISAAKNFNKALAKVKEVAEAAQADNIKVEAEFTRQQILEAYSKSTAPQASEQLTAALALTCQGQRPELPIFGLNPEKIRFGFSNTFAPLPPDWMAETPGELHYVICATETEAKIETCKYTNGFSLMRMRYVWETTLVDMSTGEKVVTEKIHGADPAACKQSASFLSGSSVSRSYGSRPTTDDLVAWLRQLNLVP
jgi:tetratricopeptide (TPR) repeat protein